MGMTYHVEYKDPNCEDAAAIYKTQTGLKIYCLGVVLYPGKDDSLHFRDRYNKDHLIVKISSREKPRSTLPKSRSLQFYRSPDLGDKVLFVLYKDPDKMKTFVSALRQTERAVRIYAGERFQRVVEE